MSDTPRTEKPEKGAAMSKAVGLADNCNAAKEKYCYVPTMQKSFRDAWLSSHELFLDEIGRVYTKVTLHGETLIMDARTGSLYRDGQCLSSSKLQLGELTENHELACQILKETE